MLNYEKIGLFLQNKRKTYGLTQKQLAEYLNITFQAVSRWEKGLSIPSIDILQDLSQLFNVSVDQILKGEDDSHMFSYAKSGVNALKFDVFNRDIERYIRNTTLNPSFRGGIYHLETTKYVDPYIVSRSLEPGSKQLLAIEYGYIQELVQDTFYTLLNDIVAIGTKPLFLTHTIVSGQDNMDFTKRYIQEFYEVAHSYQVELMHVNRSVKPNYIQNQMHMIDTQLIGIMDAKNIIDCKTIQENDDVLYIASNGLHHHGYSLIRDYMQANPLVVHETVNNHTFMEEIMKVPYCYYGCIQPLIEKGLLHGAVHIAGLGVSRNIKRIIPEGLCATIDLQKIVVPEIFSFLKQHLQVSDEEMLKTFNCGIGYILITDQEYTKQVIQTISKYFVCKKVGTIIKSSEKAMLQNQLHWK